MSRIEELQAEADQLEARAVERSLAIEPTIAHMRELDAIITAARAEIRRLRSQRAVMLAEINAMKAAIDSGDDEVPQRGRYFDAMKQAHYARYGSRYPVVRGAKNGGDE